jgi:hypothetical protein
MGQNVRDERATITRRPHGDETIDPDRWDFLSSGESIHEEVFITCKYA